MKTNTLAVAVALSDQDLLSHIHRLAGNERNVTADLVAHLAALELRPSLYEAQGYGSLFAYCTEALRLSEDAACNRIEAAGACRSFPVILDLLAAGSLTLTSVRRLRKHLTPENYEAVLARAAHKRKEQIEALVAELAPKPDVASSVRRLPVLAPSPAEPTKKHELSMMACVPVSVSGPAPLREGASLAEPSCDSGAARDENRFASPPAMGATDRPAGEAARGQREAYVPRPRPAVVQPLSPQRYRVQFTIGQEAHDNLRRLQTLLRREVPNGDVGVIFERFIDVLLDKVEREKLGKRGQAKNVETVKKAKTGSESTQVSRPDRAYENRIRSGTDRTPSRSSATGFDRRKTRSRHVPSAIKRAVWFRDRAQCAFVADTGHRCTERSFLELHHIHPYALDGPSTVGNISLRCRRHNQYEAELAFGRRYVASDDQGG